MCARWSHPVIGSGRKCLLWNIQDTSCSGTGFPAPSQWCKCPRSWATTTNTEFGCQASSHASVASLDLCQVCIDGQHNLDLVVLSSQPKFFNLSTPWSLQFTVWRQSPLPKKGEDKIMGQDEHRQMMLDGGIGVAPTIVDFI